MIFAPFLTARGAGRWIDILRAKVLQGVRVRLVTLPPGGWRGAAEEEIRELIAGIIELGIVVDLRAGMHEKFTIIDNKILARIAQHLFT